MKINAKIFYEARKIYPELTAKKVADFMKDKSQIELKQTMTNKISVQRQDDCVTISKKSELKPILKITGSDQEIQQEIEKWVDDKVFNTLIEQLLELIFDEKVVQDAQKTIS